MSLTTIPSFIFDSISVILPKTDPARTISTSALLVVGSLSVYHFSRAIYNRIKSAINERARQKRREAQKPGVVYLYIFPKKPQTKSEKKKNKTITTGALSPEHDDDVENKNEKNDEEEVCASSSVNKMSKMFSLSVPCMAVELFLRTNKIPFEEVVVMNAGDVSPTQRLPCIEYNGQVIADSSFIMDFLEKEFLSPKETKDEEKIEVTSSSPTAPSISSKRIREITIKRILDNIRLGHGRSVLVNNTNVMIATVAKEFEYPKTLLSFIFKSHRSEVINMLNAHGYGDLTEEQFEQVLLDDVMALESFITKNKKKKKKQLSSSKTEATAAAANSGEGKESEETHDKKEQKEDDTSGKEGKKENEEDDNDNDNDSESDIDEGDDDQVDEKEKGRNEKPDEKAASEKDKTSSGVKKKKKTESRSQFIHGSRMPSKVDCIIAAQLKVMRFFDESNDYAKRQKKDSNSVEEGSPTSASPTTTTEQQTSTSSSSTSKKKKKSSSSSSSSTTPIKLLSDSSPAFKYLMKSEVVSEYLRRMDKALSSVCSSSKSTTKEEEK